MGRADDGLIAASPRLGGSFHNLHRSPYSVHRGGHDAAGIARALARRYIKLGIATLGKAANVTAILCAAVLVAFGAARNFMAI